MKKTVVFTLIFLFLTKILSSQTTRPELVTQTGHSMPITSVAYSSDGKYIISGSEDGKLKLWENNTGKEIKTFISDNSGEVLSVCFSPDGNYVISGYMNGALILWDIITGDKIRTFKKHSLAVFSVSFSSNGNYVLSGGFDGTLKLWNVSSGEEIRTFEGHLYAVASVCFSPDGKFALSGSWDGTLKLWDINTGDSIRTFSGYNPPVTSVIFSPDGRNALSGSGDSTLSLWDINTGEKIRTFKGNNGYVYSVSFSPDGKYALSGSGRDPFEPKPWIIVSEEENTLNLWDISTGEELKTFTGHSYSVTSVSFSPDGKYALSGSKDRTLKLWNIKTGKAIRTLQGYRNDINYLNYSPDGKYVIWGSRDGTLKLWDISTLKEIRTFEGNNDYVSSVSFSPDGKYLLSGSWISYYDTLKLWNISTGKVIKTLGGYPSCCSSVRFSPDGKYALSGGAVCDTLRLWDISTGKAIRTFGGYRYCGSSFSFSPDGKYALTGSLRFFEVQFGEQIPRPLSWDSLLLWDINTGKIIRTFAGHSEKINSVSFSPDGKYALSGSDDRTIRLWDVSNGEEVKVFVSQSRVSSVNFSPDGKYVLSGDDSLPFLLEIWDISTGEKIRTFSGNDFALTSVNFSPDGKYVLSVSRDNKIKMWDIQKGEEILSLIIYGEKDFITITPDNYYTCSRGGLDAVAFVIDNRAFPPEQFDLQYNRPDIVLERIGYADSALIKAYREAYYKRLQKMDFKEEWFKPDFYMPEIEIENKEEFINYESNERDIKLKISAKDEKGNPLDRINVFVNGVPIFGTNGIDLTGENVFNIEKGIDVQLNDSVNKIEVSVLNHAGVESLKDNLELTYTGDEEEPKTYFIGVGVSEYKDKNKKLNFAAKDIRDLAGLYQDKAIIDTLIDEQATRENILKLKEKLLNTKVDDEIIIALSGHGLLSTGYDFYYATWDMDFKNPEKNGLLFDDLDKLLDSIPARKKVLLIDACNSGEVDKETIQNAELKKENEEIAIKDDGKKGEDLEPENEQSKSKLGLENSFELMQEIFVNLTRGNGAIVISAARGSQSALEKESYGTGNGAFTACIIELIKSKKPGEYIKVGELKDYVIKRVEELTNGSQKPTSRRENLAYDFVVW